MKWRNFFVTAIAAVAVLGWNEQAWTAQDDLADMKAQITKQHDESVKRLQDWIHQESSRLAGETHFVARNEAEVFVKCAAFICGVQDKMTLFRESKALTRDLFTFVLSQLFALSQAFRD